jgi:nitroimidazol reductase NimA-like FMN-containing flavoprotein (pyridoxamine 5'-phosphate oxidase superfamily)
MKKIKHIPVNVKPGSVNVRERLRALDSSQPHAVLATDSGNSPYTSLVAYKLTPDLKGIIFATPRNTRKYRNILKNHNVSVLIDTRSNTANDYLQAEAVTVTGSAKPVRRGRKRDELADLLRKKHPALKEFINASSTMIVLVESAVYMHVGGFQKTTEWVPED